VRGVRRLKFPNVGDIVELDLHDEEECELYVNAVENDYDTRGVITSDDSPLFVIDVTNGISCALVQVFVPRLNIVGWISPMILVNIGFIIDES